jgi:hypothetical protein
MNKKIMAASLCIIGAFGAMALVTASSLAAGSPLYIFRMEQASNQKNFFPGHVAGFTYSTEKGCTMNMGGVTCCGVSLLGFKTERDTECTDTCFSTCPITCETCPSTCDYTCSYTCDDPTCPSTCSETCGNTCEYTCDDPTCPSTCEMTCQYTCNKPCQP